MSVLAVLVKAAGGLARHERTARQSLRTAGRHCQRAGTHQPQSSDEQQVLTAKDRDVSLLTACPPPQPTPFSSSFYSSCLNFEPSSCLDQVNRQHRHLAKTGGDPLRSAGAASLYGAAESPQGEEGTTQDHSLLPLSERALYSTQVSGPLASVSPAAKDRNNKTCNYAPQCAFKRRKHHFLPLFVCLCTMAQLRFVHK